MPESNTYRGIVAGIAPPDIRRSGYAENKTGEQRATHLVVNIPARQRVKSRNCFLSFVQHALFTRCNERQQKLVGMPQTGHVNLYDELSKGSDSP